MDRYFVDYHGKKDLFEFAEDSYAAGDTVRLKFSLMATDTNYSFFADGKPAKAYPENGSFIIEFTMPDHDTEVHVEMDSSMTAMPVKKLKHRKDFNGRI